jgi:hypothetical protein
MRLVCHGNSLLSMLELVERRRRSCEWVSGDLFVGKFPDLVFWWLQNDERLQGSVSEQRDADFILPIRTSMMVHDSHA